jgi:hypothetical protein
MKFKKLTILLFITLFFNTSLFANSNKFIFNDLKLYDSLLKKFDEEEIKANIGYEDQNNKYLFYLDIFENPVEGFTHAFYYFKKGDKKYKIQSFQLEKYYSPDITYDTCLNDLSDINDKYLALLKPEKKLITSQTIKHSAADQKIYQSKAGEFMVYQYLLIGRSQQWYDTFFAQCVFPNKEYEYISPNKIQLHLFIKDFSDFRQKKVEEFNSKLK